MMEDYNDGMTFRQRLSAALDRTEVIYLRALRAIVLAVATVLILYAIWLGISGVYHVVQSPSSVVEKAAIVNADELTGVEIQEDSFPQQIPNSDKVTTEQKKFYSDFVGRYYNIFHKEFEPFRQPEDKQLSVGEFDDSFVQTSGRLDGIRNDQLDFNADKDELESLLRVMAEAAQKPQTKERLQKYKAARKVEVIKKVQRTRTETRRGWDRYSTACSDWYQDPMGCSVLRTVEIPYTETVKAMEFPKGTQSHAQIFRAFQDRYITLLRERREDAARQAQMERQSIIQGNIAGWESLKIALAVVGMFLVLMFFFLLIAIERHQRKHHGDTHQSD